MSDPYRELVVMTRPLNFEERTPGHAMIAVSTAGVGEEAWGFYPTGVEEEILKGGWHRYNRSSVIPISETQYKALKGEIDRWKQRTYVPATNDCTDFALTVMSAAKIATPNDSLWPGNLGEDMEALHGAGGGRCLNARPPVNKWQFSVP
jgi:hypothetical protein